MSSYRRKDPDLCSYVRWRCRAELENASLSEYVKIAEWARHPHLNSQASFFRSNEVGKTVKDILKRVHVFKFEDLQLLEDWLSCRYQKEIKWKCYDIVLMGLKNPKSKSRNSYMYKSSPDCHYYY